VAIELFRIDDRLIHGQVVVGWGQPLDLTFIVLANTDGLSAPYALGAGKLESSPWAREFLETFVIAKLPLP